MSSSVLDRFGNPVPDWYAGYFESLADTHFLVALSDQMSATASLIANLNPTTLGFAYADGKWTVAEVILHIIDCERIFSYRALRLARNDSTPLPGFEENEYTPNSGAAIRTVASLLEDYMAVRRSTLALFQNFTSEMLSRTGIANGHLFSAEMIGVVVAGHELHHLNVLRSRYGLGA
ncbi:MAG: DinB family protein [Bacteroidota bacterium]